MFTTKRFLITFVLLIVFLLTNTFGLVLAQTPTPTPTSAPDDSKAKDLQSQITDYQNKINELQGQEKTLNSQIQLMNNQIKLTELKIEEAQEKIKLLDKDIEIAKDKIVVLEKNINYSTKALLGRIAGVYEIGQMPSWQIFLTSNDINNFMTRLKYLKIVQMYDKKNIYATEQAKVNYANQKNILQDKQDEQEKLNEKLQSYTDQLAQERKSKEDLLAVTKNSEKEYQRRLADALKELRQIQQAASVLVSTAPRHVTKGEIIGYMGNSGYSFGAHLHFGVYNVSKLADYNYYSNHESPANSLSSQSVDWDTGCSGDPKGSTNTGSGSFAWPMSTGDLHITQGYGHTCYSDIYYKGNPHPAFDMYNNSDISIRAVDDGEAYTCRNCTGDGGNGVFLFHSNGKMTLYWHLQ